MSGHPGRHFKEWMMALIQLLNRLPTRRVQMLPTINQLLSMARVRVGDRLYAATTHHHLIPQTALLVSHGTFFAVIDVTHILRQPSPFVISGYLSYLLIWIRKIRLS